MSLFQLKVCKKKKMNLLKLGLCKNWGFSIYIVQILNFQKKKNNNNCSGIPSIYLRILFDCKGVAIFVSFGPPLVCDVHK
jgi:hypothetical protein